MSDIREIKQTIPVHYIKKGLGYHVNYDFTLPAGETKYLVFKTLDDFIHAFNRRVNAIDEDNAIIRLKVETLIGAEVDTLGNDISQNITNANLNYENNLNLKMYDETSTLISEGSRKPFSGTMAADRKRIAQDFISEEYILENESYLVLKFENEGNGELTVEYSSAGYQERRWLSE